MNVKMLETPELKLNTVLYSLGHGDLTFPTKGTLSPYYKKMYSIVVDIQPPFV